MPNTPNFPEIPDSVRGIVKSSIEQARKAFDTFAASSEKFIQSVDTSAIPAAEGLKQLNEKISAFTRQNAESNFNLALQLADAKHLSEVVELQSAHLRNQLETFSRQFEELRELTLKAVQDGTKSAGSAVQNAANAIQSNRYHG